MRLSRLLAGLSSLAVAVATSTGCAEEGTGTAQGDTINAVDYFPIEEGALWQFQVEGGGDQFGYTFLRVEEEDTAAGGLTVWPVTVSTGTEERDAEVTAILLLQVGGGWINLAGYRDPVDGTDHLFSIPAGIGRPEWKLGQAVPTDLTTDDGSAQSWSATLEELADRSVYYGTFFGAARITIDAGGDPSSPVGGTWWWGAGVGPIHHAPSTDGALMLELVYYE